MKRERRHELHENMVSQFLQQCLAYIRQHANALSWGLLAVAVVTLVAVIWLKQSDKKENERRGEFDALVVSPSMEMKPDERLSRMKDLLQRDSDPYRLALTTYEIAREYAVRALMASGTEKKELEDQANDYYTRIVEKYPKQVQTVAKAHLGLMNIAIGRGDWTRAQEENQAVQMMSSLGGYPVLQFAEEARKAMEQYKQPVVLATTEPSTQPTSASGPSSGPSTAKAPATTSAPAK